MFIDGVYIESYQLIVLSNTYSSETLTLEIPEITHITFGERFKFNIIYRLFKIFGNPYIIYRDIYGNIFSNIEANCHPNSNNVISLKQKIKSKSNIKSKLGEVARKIHYY